MGKRVLIGNMSLRTSEHDLLTFIAGAGQQVDRVDIATNRGSGRSRGFGFAELAAGANAAKLIEALNGRELHGNMLRVSEAQQREERQWGPLGEFGGRW